jgi:hypothetical protein
VHSLLQHALLTTSMGPVNPIARSGAEEYPPRYSLPRGPRVRMCPAISFAHVQMGLANEGARSHPSLAPLLQHPELNGPESDSHTAGNTWQHSLLSCSSTSGTAIPERNQLVRRSWKLKLEFSAATGAPPDPSHGPGCGTPSVVQQFSSGATASRSAILHRL